MNPSIQKIRDKIYENDLSTNPACCFRSFAKGSQLQMLVTVTFKLDYINKRCTDVELNS